MIRRVPNMKENRLGLRTADSQFNLTANGACSFSDKVYEKEIAK